MGGGREWTKRRGLCVYKKTIQGERREELWKMTFLVSCYDLELLWGCFPLTFPLIHLSHFSCGVMPKNSLSPGIFQPSKEGEFSRSPFNKHLVPLHSTPSTAPGTSPHKSHYQKSLDSCSDPLRPVLDLLRHYGMLLNLGCVFWLGPDCPLCSK